ncbi:MAG: 3-methyladenine DNA glycosylase [Mycolicibacterium neoaurum]|uniref:3-methyladenine DNA glycosylase n=1 Tax=Mycolicibacterium neoaurum TaxID=1795 RepID=UPI002FFC1849
MTELGQDAWTAREAAHRRRVETFVAPHLERARRGQPHPVWDFLFTYYSLRPRQLRRWHPGFGVALSGPDARRFLDRSGYTEIDGLVCVSDELLRSRRDTVEFIAALLRGTARRPARFNCFGLHEWAMVYRSDEVRHDAVPLRLGAAGTDAVVESMPLRCSHFDAFRFFTPAAVGRNAEQLTRDGQLAAEQPGCLHSGMDLYKWAYKLGPLVESELVLDCLDLAADARVLDMCASPYDLTDYGFAPVAIETAAGRAEYARAQQDIADRAAPLRAELLARCDALRARLPAPVRA